MRPLALALTTLAAAAAPAAADRPPRFVAVDLRVDRAAHRVHLATIVEDDAGQVLQRRYRTTLRYRCGTGRWHVAARTPPAPASIALRWRYGRALGGRTCRFRATVARRGGGSASSATYRRRL
jgi:hypothetical protein